MYGTAFDSDALPPTRIDLEIAWSFLETLGGESLWTFQTFDDSPVKRRELIAIFHATTSGFLKVADTLAALNESGAGIFFCVNRTDGRGRRQENVQSLRAFFVDADDRLMPREWHRSPDMVVYRDMSHWHAYWKVAHDTPLELFKNRQRRLAHHYGTDCSVSDLPRVMRLPGFLHRKKTPTLIHYETRSQSERRESA
jgi:hypothetical protein